MNVNYIVANYIGENRYHNYYTERFKLDPLYFFKKHLDFFSKTHLSFITPTFVFNDDIDDNLKLKILKLAKEYEVVFRKNAGFSYGAWEEVIEKNLNKYDYFFLIEDDYIPAQSDFIEHHLRKINSEVAVVCARISYSSEFGYVNNDQKGTLDFPYPAISNGLITAEACRLAKKTFGKVFCLNYFNDYNNAHANQLFYCLYFFKLGYKIIDILDEFSSPFYSPISDVTVHYGGDKPFLIQPIL